MRRMGMMAAALLSASCGSEVTVDETCEPQGIGKAFFVGTDRTTDTDAPAFTMDVEVLGTTFEGPDAPFFADSTKTVYFEVAEDYLIARQREAMDQPVAAFRIRGHFTATCSPVPPCLALDSSCPPHPSGGTPWPERTRFAIDWATNHVTDGPTFDGTQSAWPEADYRSVTDYHPEDGLTFAPMRIVVHGRVEAIVPIEGDADGCSAIPPSSECEAGIVEVRLTFSRDGSDG